MSHASTYAGGAKHAVVMDTIAAAVGQGIAVENLADADKEIARRHLFQQFISLGMIQTAVKPGKGHVSVVAVHP